MSYLSFFWSMLSKFKYVIVLAAIVFVNVFADENSFINRRDRQAHIARMEHEIDSIKQVYQRDSCNLDLLLNSKQELERIARETYHMHRPDEDVFIIPSTKK